MNRKQSIHLIFDFDGTLVDSFDVALQTVQRLAYEFHFRKISADEIIQLKNLTSRALIRHLNIPLYKLPWVLHHARKYMRQEIANLSTFADLPHVLTELHHLGHALSILTSNAKDNVELWLERHHIRHLFDFIHAESSYFGKKHHLKKIIKSHGMTPADTFYIGDETRDIDAAQQCNIPSIAVAWGFNSEHTLMQSKPSYLAKTPHDLLNIISTQVSRLLL